MWYVYVLQSLKDKTLYTGVTSDLKRRVKEHNNKKSRYTSRRGPYKLIFYETFVNKTDALKDEKFFKSGYGREVLREKLGNTLT